MKRPFQLTLIGLLFVFAIHHRGALADPDVEIRVGNPAAISSTQDNDTTKIHVKGSVTFQKIDAGPAFGSGIGGQAYRITGEPNMDPSFVERFESYTREIYDPATGGTPWGYNLTKVGMCIGCLVGDGTGAFPAWPQYRLDVRGDMRLAGAGETFFRIGSKSSTTTVNVGYLFERAGDPKWSVGLLNSQCPTSPAGNDNDLVFCKRSAATGWYWVRAATFAY